MQWIIEFLLSHNIQLVVLIVAWTLGIAMALAFSPRPILIAAQPKVLVHSQSDVQEFRRKAAEYAVRLYTQLRPVFTGIPQEFWETVNDSDFQGLMLDELLRADRIPYKGLSSVVDAFTLEDYEHGPHVLGAICINDAAIADLMRFADRVRGFKARQQK